MLLLLVRHGLTPMTGKKLTGWLPGHHLSEAGRAQAEAVAKKLAKVPISAVYSSPLERCRETAALIARSGGLRIRTLKEVGEIRYGDWQGRSFKSLYRTKAWTEMNSNRADFRFPNGETPREAQARAMKAIEGLRRSHGNQAVVVVSHADLIRLVVAGYIGLALDLYHRISIGPASVSVLRFGPQFPSLLALNHPGDLDWAMPRMKAAARAK